MLFHNRLVKAVTKTTQEEKKKKTKTRLFCSVLVPLSLSSCSDLSLPVCLKLSHLLILTLHPPSSILHPSSFILHRPADRRQSENLPLLLWRFYSPLLLQPSRLKGQTRGGRKLETLNGWTSCDRTWEHSVLSCSSKYIDIHVYKYIGKTQSTQLLSHLERFYKRH